MTDSEKIRVFERLIEAMPEEDGFHLHDTEVAGRRLVHDEKRLWVLPNLERMSIHDRWACDSYEWILVDTKRLPAEVAEIARELRAEKKRVIPFPWKIARSGDTDGNDVQDAGRDAGRGSR